MPVERRHVKPRRKNTSRTRPIPVAATILLVAAVLVLPVVGAQEARPVPQSVWTVYNIVDAEIVDNYARVKVIAEIRNRGPDPEFPFQVRVPDDAFVTGLTIERDGRIYEAEIKGRDQARQEYEDWKQQQYTGGLVEKARRTSVYAYLINVAEFESVTATLTYERYLVADRGILNVSLEAPVSGFGRDLGARFDVSIRHDDGVVAAWGIPGTSVSENDGQWFLSHSVGPRPDDAPTPYTASYVVAPTGESGSLVVFERDGQGYFAHRFRAPADAETLPIDLVLVLDVSGSMLGLKMQQMQDAARQVLQFLGPEDRVNVVYFSSDAGWTWPGLRAATGDTRREAAEAVENLFAAGGTNIQAGIEAGFEAFEAINWSGSDGRLPALVFLTDGQPSAGATNADELRELARAANEHGVHVFSLAFGSDADWGLVHAFAEDGHGVALWVPEGAGAEVDLRRFVTGLTAPVLRDIQVVYEGPVEAGLRPVPILFAGSEILILGTYDPGLEEIRGRVTATGPDGPREYEFAFAIEGAQAGPFLPRLAAYQEIRDLQDRIRAEGEEDEWVERIEELGLELGFVTDYTSLVVLLDPREFRPIAAEEMTVTDAGATWSSASGAPPTTRLMQDRSAAPPSSQVDRDAAVRGHDDSTQHADERATPAAAWLGVILALAAVALLRRY